MRMGRVMFAKRLLVLPLALLAACAAASEPEEDAALASSEPVSAQQQWIDTCEEWDDWDKPALAFPIYGNTWYTGTCGISAVLITGEDGHILIDGGPIGSADAIVRAMQSFGFDIKDVRLLLSSHEHHDHVGALAELQRRSGAVYHASPAAAQTMRTGRSTPEDPQFGVADAFEPVRVDGLVRDGTPERVGELSVTPIPTPGHTPGAMSWQWESCERGECRTIVYADSLSPVSAEGYLFSEDEDLVEAYRASLKRLAQLDCDILITPHPSASNMHDRLASNMNDGVADAVAWIDPQGCANYAAAIEKRLDERLAEERDGE